MKLIDILKQNKILYNLSSELPGDDFPGGGGGGGGSTTGGGTGGGGSGTTSSNTIPTLSLNPSTDQSIAVGTTLCLNASGSIYLPQEPEQNAVLNAGCAQSLGSGTWTKNCGTNNAPDAETVNTTLLYRQQSFYIIARNGQFTTPGGGNNNTDSILGVKTTNGYYFYWEVFKYCNATPGNCNSNWLGYVRVINPNGVGTTLAGGLVEANQHFKVSSDGTRIIWEYTTHGNWAYNYYSIPIPADAGDFQFFVNGLYLGNTWNDIRTYRGSYQGTVAPNDFIWTSNCLDNLVINGSTACYTPLVPGSCRVCVSTINTEAKCINLIASPLYIKPVNQNCNSCGDVTNCLNIPDPTLPNVSLSSTSSTSLNIEWEDSVSFTNGLYYQVDINGTIQDVVDSNIALDDLTVGDYVVSVRSIDSCGNSGWSSPQTIAVGAESEFDAPDHFVVTVLDDTNPSNTVYGATWNEVDGAIGYEVWAGNPQNTLIVSTTLTTITLGVLFSGLSLSVRAIDAFSNYSPFSNIEVI